MDILSSALLDIKGVFYKHTYRRVCCRYLEYHSSLSLYCVDIYLLSHCDTQIDDVV